MSYVQVSAIDLIVIGAFAAIAAWRWPTIRPLGALLFMAAAITPFTSPLSVEAKGLIYLIVDVVGGVVGAMVYVRHRQTAGLAFLVFAILSCIAHLAMFANPPHTTDQHYMYVLTLNVLFILSCICVGGDGLARSHRHLWQRDRHRVAYAPSRTGG